MKIKAIELPGVIVLLTGDEKDSLTLIEYVRGEWFVFGIDGTVTYRTDDRLSFLDQ